MGVVSRCIGSVEVLKVGNVYRVNLFEEVGCLSYSDVSCYNPLRIAYTYYVYIL